MIHPRPQLAVGEDGTQPKLWALHAPTTSKGLQPLGPVVFSDVSPGEEAKQGPGGSSPGQVGCSQGLAALLQGSPSCLLTAGLHQLPSTVC